VGTVITAILFGDPQSVIFQKDSVALLTAALKKHAPRKPIDFAVLIRVKASFKTLKSNPYSRRHAKQPSVLSMASIVSDCLRPAGWITDDALVDQLVVEKCRTGDPYLEVTMKERL
jgi:Holliday junction resolvase RusA-like endonuclease